MDKLKVIEIFAGAGAYSKALGNIGINNEVVAAIEFDEKTMRCYNVIHGTSFESSDVTKVNPDDMPECDIVCYSPPCQTFSAAGNGAGTTDPRGTLFYNALRIITAKKPRYAIMENVKNLTSKKHRATFDDMLNSLSSAGYTNYWKVLNSKEHGVPQNRERVFVISIRNDVEQSSAFPKPYDNGVRLRDILEDEVDEKFYISDEKCAKLLEEIRRRGDSLYYAGMYQGCSEKFFRGTLPNTARTVKSRGDHNAAVIPSKHGVLVNHGVAKIKTDDFATCIDANYWKGLDNHAQRTGVLEANEIDMVGRCDLNGNDICKRVYSVEGISPTIPTGSSGNTMPKVLVEFDVIYRIRKLTPLECFRLQAFSDDDHAKLVEAKISNSQLYKLMGNSITVSVLEDIFRVLLCPTAEQ